jgi:diacylglycerol kinase family enzyme
VNASAGTVESLDAAALRATLAAAFERHGIEANLAFLTAVGLKEAAERARQQVLDRELDAVVVGGGDGSINTVASVLAGSGVPLGILALGTLNHFAKDLGLPLAPKEAVTMIAAGMTRSVDLGEVNGEIFINNSSIGIYPLLVIERERRRRHGHLSKWAAMILAVPRVVRYLPIFRLRIRLPGAAELLRSPCLFVGNNEYRLAIPRLGTRERLDCGELCLYAAKAQSLVAFLRLAVRIIFGLLKQERDLRIFKGRTAEIDSRRHWLLVATDGEVKSMRSPLHYASRPGALRVFAPAGADG